MEWCIGRSRGWCWYKPWWYSYSWSNCWNHARYPSWELSRCIRFSWCWCGNKIWSIGFSWCWSWYHSRSVWRICKSRTWCWILHSCWYWELSWSIGLSWSWSWYKPWWICIAWGRCWFHAWNPCWIHSWSICHSRSRCW